MTQRRQGRAMIILAGDRLQDAARVEGFEASYQQQFTFLPGFWRGSWRDVVRDMKGRYPKHRWPDQPWLEKPSMKTKNAFNRSDS